MHACMRVCACTYVQAHVGGARRQYVQAHGGRTASHPECVDQNCVVKEGYHRGVLPCFGRRKSRGRRCQNNISKKIGGEIREKNREKSKKSKSPQLHLFTF